jgi:16S rRNA C967 or C1407 C5-methylase (RsmB/RsmF family)
MEKLPALLLTRLTTIFSPEEMDQLKTVFELKRKPVSFRVNTLKSDLDEIIAELENNSIEYTVLKFPKNAILLDEKYIESDVWKLNIYKL